MSNNTHEKFEFGREDVKQLVGKASSDDSTELLSIFDKVAAAIRAKHL